MGVDWGEDGSACQQSHTQDIHGNVCVEFWRHWRTHAIILTDADLNEQVLPEYCTSLYACNTISHSHTDAHSSKIHVISRMFSSTPRRQWDWGRLHRPLHGRLSVGDSSSPALLFHLLLISNLNEKGKWCCNSKKRKKKIFNSKPVFTARYFVTGLCHSESSKMSSTKKHANQLHPSVFHS